MVTPTAGAVVLVPFPFSDLSQANLSLGELLEGIVLHAFANRPPFSADTLQRIAQLKQVYGMAYDVAMSHRLTEDAPAPERPPAHSKGA